MTTTTTTPTRSAEAPPREDLVRAFVGGDLELREGDGDGGTGATMVGHFAVFNRWTEIDSWWEGRFLEQLAPGAFRKTMKDNRAGMRVLFQHGHDPSVGDKPLGTIDELKEDDTGAYYEVGLIDAGYVREDILPGLRAGLYGASFRFKVLREEFVEEPGVSAHNPQGIPERTIKEARVMEFGPVTFPAYADATAGIRSITDQILFARLAEDPEALRSLLMALGRPDPLASRPEAGKGIVVTDALRADGDVTAEEEPAADSGTGSDDAEQDLEVEEPAADSGTGSDPEEEAEGDESPENDDRAAPGDRPTQHEHGLAYPKTKEPKWRL